MCLQCSCHPEQENQVGGGEGGGRGLTFNSLGLGKNQDAYVKLSTSFQWFENTYALNAEGIQHPSMTA